MVIKVNDIWCREGGIRERNPVTKYLLKFSPPPHLTIAINQKEIPD